MVAMDAVGRRRPARAGPPGRAVRRAAAVSASTRCSTCSPAATRRRLRRAAAAARLGPRHRRRSPVARARSGWPSPAAARSPTAACSASSWPAARRRRQGRGGPGRRARRGDGLRVAGRRRLHARLARPGGSRTSPTTGCSSRRRPAQPGRLPFWKGDALGRPAELGRAVGAFVREVGGAQRRARRSRRVSAAGLDALGRRQPARATCASSARPPGTCPTTARSWSSGSATSSATGGSSCTPRSARRCTRPGRWRSAARLRERYGVDAQAMHADDGIVLRLPDTDAAVDGEPPAAEITRCCSDPDEVEPLVDDRGRRLGAVRLPVPRVRRPGAAAAPARPRPAHAAVAAAPALGPAAVGRARVRLVPDRPGDDARVPAGRLRRARPRRR